MNAVTEVPVLRGGGRDVNGGHAEGHDADTIKQKVSVSGNVYE